LEILTLVHDLYKNTLSDIAVLEFVGDSVDQLERLARRHAQANPRLRTALSEFESGVQRVFDECLYPDLLKLREAVIEHEDRMAREALSLAPGFVRRVVHLKKATNRKGPDHA
jgi:hypothetical protein